MWVIYMKKNMDKFTENIEKQIIDNFKMAKALTRDLMYVPALDSDIERDIRRIEISELSIEQISSADLGQQVGFFHDIRNTGNGVILLITSILGNYRFMVDDNVVEIHLYIAMEYTINSSNYHKSIKKCNLEEVYYIYYKSLSDIKELGKLRIPSNYILLPSKLEEKYIETYRINPKTP